MAVLIGNEANPKSVANGLRLFESGCIRFLFFLLVFAIGVSASSQEQTLAPPMPAAPESSLDIAQVQQPAATPMPGDPLLGSIFGVVVSKDGAVFEGVRVALAQTGPGAAAVRTQTTDAGGAFNFTGAPPGAFNLIVASNGFATQVISGVLHAGESYDAHDIVLSLSTARSEVRVSASEQDIAVEQLHEEEHQYVLGIIPNFYVSYVHDAPPLSTRQKYQLAWKSSIDPFTFLIAGGIAGVEQADNTFRGYGQGAQGYAKRYGAFYADNFADNMIGGAILPSLFKQDPRYFYKGAGTNRSRALYAIANAVVCKGDNGRWQVNYSSIIGSLAAGGISNLYYPASDRNGTAVTFESTLIGFAGSAVQNLFQEFVVRKLTPKLPQLGGSKP